MAVALGMNFWQAAWLGRADRARLERELDRLAEVGIRQVRLLFGAEGPNDARGRVVPAMQPAPGVVDEEVLVGLERALAGLEARSMRAIACLGNFWSWSGGLAQYRAWAGSGSIPEPLDGAEYVAFGAGFYRDAAARRLYEGWVDRMVERFAGAPAIGVWQILNEPRGIHDPAGMRTFLGETAERIAARDSSRPVATGSEGSTADPEAAGLDFAADHAHPAIGVTTCHLWPENWGLWDPRSGTDAELDEVLRWSRAYLRRHAAVAKELGKPLHFEELGLARDGRRLDAEGTTRCRDRFFAAMIDECETLAAEGFPVEAICFWVWSGEGLGADRAPGLGGGDPPHEPDGWYGIAASDEATLALLRARSRRG